MLKDIHTIFIVGIKGVGMANLAIILSQMGKHVSGSDTSHEFITDKELIRQKITVIHSFEPDTLPSSTELVVYSAAHGGNENPQVQEAKKRGIRVLHQAELLQEIAKLHHTSIAVCGCHGKTTTTSMLAQLLDLTESPVSYFIGTSSIGDKPAGQYGLSGSFVYEADEYGMDPPRDTTPKFLFYSPDYILCTNIDYDHPDIYKSKEEVKRAFVTFFKKIQEKKYAQRKIFLCADDPLSMQAAEELDSEVYLTYGFAREAHIRIEDFTTDTDYSQFRLIFNHLSRGGFDIDFGLFKVPLFGKKIIGNVAGAIALLLNWDYSVVDIQKKLETFKGPKRRFEFIKKMDDVYIFDDYAHHPQEIEATLDAARLRFKNRDILIIFQPHTYSRTAALEEEFIAALAKADHTFLLPIFPSARENKEMFAISSEDLVQKAHTKGIVNITYIPSPEELSQYMAPYIKDNSVIMTMGAGDVYKVAPMITKHVRHSGEE
ncbi:MAG: UDP-N-acetylmuramate--L-alanine ligase [bacterium]|nr:UDP-N-acetylmuramate--L-alanine ligase [bacterium]